jgi:hypothetical protein
MLSLKELLIKLAKDSPARPDKAIVRDHKPSISKSPIKPTSAFIPPLNARIGRRIPGRWGKSAEYLMASALK